MIFHLSGKSTFGVVMGLLANFMVPKKCHGHIWPSTYQLTVLLFEIIHLRILPLVFGHTDFRVLELGKTHNVG